MGVVFIVVGFALVLVSVVDAFDTLLAINMRESTYSPAAVATRAIWRVWRGVARRIGHVDRRETFLGIYGPLTFLGMLAVWVAGQIVGFGLVWWGFRDSFATDLADVPEAIYYSGVVFFSIGFGDVLPATGGVRWLTVVEAFGGLATLGLVIGYLPALSAAYSAREKQLLLLDDLTEDEVTAPSLLGGYLAGATVPGDVDEIRQFFWDWDRWCGDVFESHSSFPMLVLWRSKHRGHSWVAALGAITDAAMTYVAVVPEGPAHPSARRLLRQSSALLRYLGRRLHVEPRPLQPLSEERWAQVHATVAPSCRAVRPLDESFEVAAALHARFAPHLAALQRELLAPAAFVGVSAAGYSDEAPA